VTFAPSQARAASACVVQCLYKEVICDGKQVDTITDETISAATVELKKLIQDGYKIVSQSDGEWTLVN